MRTFYCISYTVKRTVFCYLKKNNCYYMPQFQIENFYSKHLDLVG